ncbi:Protoporphyrin uptake protein 1 [Fusarium oxysporum f. sp. albedinis]|nr:Protoporphyrin uptake protein 1 [Fusarium oxysporum f. sp. albedinis]
MHTFSPNVEYFVLHELMTVRTLRCLRELTTNLKNACLGFGSSLRLQVCQKLEIPNSVATFTLPLRRHASCRFNRGATRVSAPCYLIKD